MARSLRLARVQRNLLICMALFITITVLVASEYHVPRDIAVSLDELYDSPVVPQTRRPQSLSDSSSSPSRILIVSAFFPVPQANRPPEAYLAWLTPFLRPITTDIYFYTTPDLAPSIGSARGPGLPLVVDTSFASPFDIPPLKRREVVYGQMHKLDEERAISSPELYALRNAKPFFVEHAIKSMKAEYDYVFWNDADSFRDEHGYTTWPDPARIQRVWEQGTNLTGTEKKDLIFFPVVNPLPKNMASWVEDSGPISSDFSGGSFFGGPPAAMAWFSRAFYSYHDHFLTLGYFTGKDETIYNALLLLFPSRFITVWPYDPFAPALSGLAPSFMRLGYLGACGPDRYYYQWWLSNRETRDKMRDWWMAHGPEPEGGEWWKIKVPCRFTRTLGIEGLLQRGFGSGWKPPIATIEKPSRTW